MTKRVKTNRIAGIDFFNKQKIKTKIQELPQLVEEDRELVMVFETLWEAVLFGFFVFVAIASAITIWLRRREGIFESRTREQPGIRDAVQKGFSELAGRAKEIETTEDAKQFGEDLLVRMEMQLYPPVVDQFRSLLKDIEHRTDFKQILRTCENKLNAMTETLHYSDIRRHPRR